nr:hypothetical protein GCM10020063_040700 [Dactylosporangium thailandense]
MTQPFDPNYGIHSVAQESRSRSISPDQAAPRPSVRRRRSSEELAAQTLGYAGADSDNDRVRQANVVDARSRFGRTFDQITAALDYVNIGTAQGLALVKFIGAQAAATHPKVGNGIEYAANVSQGLNGVVKLLKGGRGLYNAQYPHEKSEAERTIYSGIADLTAVGVDVASMLNSDLVSLRIAKVVVPYVTSTIDTTWERINQERYAGSGRRNAIALEDNVPGQTTTARDLYEAARIVHYAGTDVDPAVWQSKVLSSMMTIAPYVSAGTKQGNALMTVIGDSLKEAGTPLAGKTALGAECAGTGLTIIGTITEMYQNYARRQYAQMAFNAGNLAAAGLAIGSLVEPTAHLRTAQAAVGYGATTLVTVADRVNAYWASKHPQADVEQTLAARSGRRIRHAQPLQDPPAAYRGGNQQQRRGPRQ